MMNLTARAPEGLIRAVVHRHHHLFHHLFTLDDEDGGDPRHVSCGLPQRKKETAAYALAWPSCTTSG